MSTNKNKKLQYLVPLAFFFVMIICMVFFLMKNERTQLKDHYEDELSGFVIDIKPFGRGAYQYFVQGKDSLYKVSFEGKKNINLRDSIIKEKGNEYFVYRKNERDNYIIVARYLY